MALSDLPRDHQETRWIACAPDRQEAAYTEGVRRALLALALAPLAALAQFAVQEVPDVVYTQASGFPQALDLYLPFPVTSTARPALVLVHGGGWMFGDKSDFADWGRYFAARGYVCASVDYRLTPTHIWPAQLDDVQASVRWLRRHAVALSLSPERIGTVGGSAGGHLALFLGARETLNDFDPDLRGYSSRVRAVVDIYGPTDIGDLTEFRRDLWVLVFALMGQPWSRQSLVYRAASPITFVTPDDAATLVFQGALDDVVPPSQSRRLVDRMRASGVPVEYFEFADQGHGFDPPTNTFVIETAARFLQGTL